MFVWKTIREWLIYMLCSFLFILIVGMYVFQPIKVEGHSMDPTLQDNQKVYMHKLNHTFSRTPDYGQIVVIDSRLEKSRTIADEFLDTPIVRLFVRSDNPYLWIKRVIALPGDEIIVKDFKVFLNGSPIDEPYLNEVMSTPLEQKWVIPEGYVFVMGDNRNFSKDSRIIGLIPIDHIIGTKI